MISTIARFVTLFLIISWLRRQIHFEVLLMDEKAEKNA